MISCQLCNSEDIKKINTQIRNISDPTIQVFACENCGVHFLYPQHTEQELADYYDGQYRTMYADPDYYQEQKIEAFYQQSLPEAYARVDRVSDYLNETDCVLEIGCASGYFLDAIKQKVSSISGTEWDYQNALFAQRKGFTVKKEISEYDQQFDKIFMFHVLEHIRKPLDFLQQLRRHLTANGHLFIEVPNIDDVLIKTYKLAEFRNFYYQSAHLWYFNRESLETVLMRAGYKVEIKPIQRYDISNHLNWLINRQPGGQGIFKSIFSEGCNLEYQKSLINANQTDTLFAICTKA